MNKRTTIFYRVFKFVKSICLQNDLTGGEFKDALEQSLKAPSVGVVFWNCDAIKESLEKKAIIMKIIIDNNGT